jgi:hypothetical protein
VAFKKDRPRKPDKTGRNHNKGRFLRIDHRMFLSEAFGSLSVTARALLLELIAMESGENNGSLWLSVRDATARLGMSDVKAVRRAFEDLSGAGLIAMTKDSHFSVKASETSRARCWRLTWLVWTNGPRNKRAPTQDWEGYTAPPKSKEWLRVDRRNRAMASYRKALAENHLPVVDFTTTEVKMPENTPLPVEDSTTAISQIHAKQPFSVVEDSTPHTAVTMGSTCIGWWANDAMANLVAQSLLLACMTQSRARNGPGCMRDISGGDVTERNALRHVTVTHWRGTGSELVGKNGAAHKHWSG